MGNEQRAGSSCSGTSDGRAGGALTTMLTAALVVKVIVRLIDNKSNYKLQH